MMYGVSKKKMMMYGCKKKMMKAGGAKPDYLDFDKDGDKNESMKSALASKKKKKEMGMGGKKMMYQMGGFIEPGVFDLDRD